MEGQIDVKKGVGLSFLFIYFFAGLPLTLVCKRTSVSCHVGWLDGRRCNLHFSMILAISNVGEN